MVEQQFRIAEIEVAKSPTDEKIIGLFRYEGNTLQKRGTSLLILAEINSTLYSYERLLDVINATAEQTKHMVAGVEQDPVARFEKLIQRLNDSVATFLEGEPTPLSWSRVNLFVVELSQDHICLTGRGRLMNVFLQKQDDGSYRTFDLFGSLEQPVDVDPKKPFASLICGDMKPGDLLIAGTTNLERLRNELRIKERLTTLPPVSAALEIKQDLERRGIPDDFIAAVVACCELEMPTSPPPKAIVPETDRSTASINKLRETEKDTTQHLSPTITPAPATANTQPLQKRVVAGVFGLVKAARKHLKRDRIKDVAAMTSLRGMSAGHGSVFTAKHKRIAIIVGAVLILAIGAFSYWKHTQRLASEAAAWQASFDQATDNRNRAESDLVYANDSRATKEIETAEGIISNLETTQPEHAKKIATLKTDLGQLRERLRKIMPIDQVTELAALTGVADGTLAAPVLTKDTAYAVDNSTHNILKIDLTNKTIKQIALPASSGPIVAGSHGKQSVVFTTAKGAFYAVDITSDKVTPLTTLQRTSSTTDLVLYANKAYKLDGVNAQIWRAAASGNGFGAESAYIKASNTPLTGAVGIAIDSNVYVLKADGTLARYLSGGEDGFSLTVVDPPLRAASGIWTTPDTQRIVITDPAGKRVMIFNKDGTLKAQMTSAQFTGPRDVDGDDATKRLIVIDGTRLLLLNLP